jgi:hypothetical protein
LQCPTENTECNIFIKTFYQCFQYNYKNHGNCYITNKLSFLLAQTFSNFDLFSFSTKFSLYLTEQSVIWDLGRNFVFITQ